MRLLGQVGSFSSTSLSQSHGSMSLSLAVPNRLQAACMRKAAQFHNAQGKQRLVLPAIIHREGDNATIKLPTTRAESAAHGCRCDCAGNRTQ